MKTKLLIATVAALAVASTAANAGGFRYASVGGNFGTWAYSDGQAGGSAAIIGLGIGAAGSESAATSEAWKGYYSSGSSAAAANVSQFQGLGIGVAKSTSSAVAGSGVGYGIGFKLGGISHR